MRRVIMVAVLVAGLCPAVACAAEPPAAAPSTTAGPAGSTAGPTAGDGAPTGGDSPAVCAAVRRAGEVAVRTYDEELGRMVAAVGAGDGTAAETARGRAGAALDGWRTVLREQSARAADPQLGALLDDLAGEVAAMGADVDSFDETGLDRLRQRLDRLCPG
ncbi:hypothetical protein E1211_26545 [Micromonospora sp. 15K316]|uniref:hypothetical protein n=1 Tax=Micromonospora sp. 15K316 TaxID=2530376 RepID=UPI001045CC7B|nr:hypothetical protein [Micromonospora sp. 15K316]TDC29146.1 hypothetical protein E1211_26545 [Micromonospora sp. 15K316]